MSEFQQAMRIAGGNLGLHLDHWPSGKWGFIGSVPADCAYQMPDGSVPSDEVIKDIKRSCMPAMSMKQHGVKTRSFESKEAALAYASERGYEVLSAR